MENGRPTLIVNGTIPGSGTSGPGSVAIRNGRIEAVGELDPRDFPGYEMFDASGKPIIPGGFDPHVHMALPTPAGSSCDDFATGSEAALRGGTTFFMDFVTPLRGQSLHEALALRRREAERCRCGYGLHMGISEWNEDIEAEIAPLVAHEGIRSFKAYLAYNETIGIGYEELESLMRVAGAAGALVMVHCEEGPMIAAKRQQLFAEGKCRPCFHAASRPPEAEIRAIAKVIRLVEKTGCPAYIVHISTGEGADLAAEAKANGLPVFAETCPHYLLFDDSVYDPARDDRSVLPFILSPPIRSKRDQETLWKRLADGTIDVVATDHCPFRNAGQKDRGLRDFTGIPNGAGGVAQRLEALYTYGVTTGRISLQRFVDLISRRPAEIFGFGGRKGSLLPGMDADLVVWDPTGERLIAGEDGFGTCDHSLYTGIRTKGRASLVIAGGKVYNLSI